MKPILMIVMLALATSGGHIEGANTKRCGKMEVTLKKGPIDPNKPKEKSDVVAEIYLGGAVPRTTYCVQLMHNGKNMAEVQFIYYGRPKSDEREVWSDFKITSQTGEPLQLYYAGNGYKKYPPDLRPLEEIDVLIGSTKIAACISGVPVMFHPCWHEEDIVLYQLDTTGNNAFSEFNTWAKKVCQAK